ncbi:1,4-alpha-glucan-branching enzyme GlgB [Gottschalkia purinilytica]|uniref:1,4-alpha-glucan branching enzyme GlgB n=1 Tax=Gottschalkia purinilytica TaxID=1503 RepID=A0A0L0W8Y7_GOTPU|nr:1,4-alpha-glucan branching protein GlgB [Gottschalkia purinilytica]KNF07922.1 1,4-alpha-glucan-branching enzyme GlgB [Gottschalkia purinilytica]
MTINILDDEFEYLCEIENFKSYKVLGAHIRKENKKIGVRFSVWAPNAKSVSVVGNFNDWCGKKHRMKKLSKKNIWSLFIPGLKEGELYKYEIETKEGKRFLKSDPNGFYHELRPNNASIVFDVFDYNWTDSKYQKIKEKRDIYSEPMIIYEVHLGSWRRKENGEFLTYVELADQLLDYVVDMGYTHIEIMPLIEHPFDGSWGYQGVGYYSITSRYGDPKDFMYFIDKCHSLGIGVILDWIPAHFCKDEHGLAMFDGTPVYEYENPIKGENHQWGTLNFDLGKEEVVNFLISNAMFYFDIFHIDGLRIDAVSSMLYLNFGKEDGAWIPNKHGGNENIEAIRFMRKLNEVVFSKYPNALMIAEESTAWPLVSKPTYLGGLGYNYKWNMGWMNDMLKYMQMDSVYRKWHHELITFSFMYAFSENFILPLSHDEVVHCKKSLLDKMHGDYWQKFAGLRLLYGYMMCHPGKKLLFMSGEFGQFIEWNYNSELDWCLLEYDMHRKLQLYNKELNHIYRKEKALWEIDHSSDGFEWIDPHNYSQSIITFMRKGKKKEEYIIVVCNFTPTVYENYRIGVPDLGEYKEIFNSDWEKYGGSGYRNIDTLISNEKKWHSQPYSLEMKVPPLGCVYLKMIKPIEKDKKDKSLNEINLNTNKKSLKTRR